MTKVHRVRITKPKKPYWYSSYVGLDVDVTYNPNQPRTKFGPKYYIIDTKHNRQVLSKKYKEMDEFDFEINHLYIHLDCTGLPSSSKKTTNKATALILRLNEVIKEP